MPENQDMDALLRNLAAGIQDGEGYLVLTKSEVGEVRKMLAGYAMLQSWGKLGRLLIWLILTAAAVKVGIDNLGGGK